MRDRSQKRPTSAKIEKNPTNDENTKTQTEMSHVLNADECTAALERALVAMEPPLDVYDCILRLIAEFVPYHGGEASPRSPGFSLSRAGGHCVLSFRRSVQRGREHRLLHNLKRWQNSDAEHKVRLLQLRSFRLRVAELYRHTMCSALSFMFFNFGRFVGGGARCPVHIFTDCNLTCGWPPRMVSSLLSSPLPSPPLAALSQRRAISGNHTAKFRIDSLRQGDAIGLLALVVTFEHACLVAILTRHSLCRASRTTAARTLLPRLR